jgi:hypothetical protein
VVSTLPEGVRDAVRYFLANPGLSSILYSLWSACAYSISSPSLTDGRCRRSIVPSTSGPAIYELFPGDLNHKETLHHLSDLPPKPTASRPVNGTLQQRKYQQQALTNGRTDARIVSDKSSIRNRPSRYHQRTDGMHAFSCSFPPIRTWR